MPPRLPALAAYCRAAPIRSSLVALLQPLVQARNASILNTLSNIPESYKKRIRRGRGASSGKGKTSGRGHKGQKQHGKTPTRFQGGQTPLEDVHGYRGFVNKYEIPDSFSGARDIRIPRSYANITAAFLLRCLP